MDSLANTYTGPTTVAAGKLVLSRNSGQVILGDLMIGSQQGLLTIGATVEEHIRGQISSDSQVALNRLSLFDISRISTANSEDIGSLTGAGSVELGPARLRCGGSGAAHHEYVHRRDQWHRRPFEGG